MSCFGVADAGTLDQPADSCQTYGLAKGLARTAADAADSPCIAICGEATMSRVSDDEVLLLWQALWAYRSGKKPWCGVLLSPDLTRIGT